MAIILTCLFVIAPLEILFSAWILTIIWGWFMPAIFGLPVLPIAAAIGIAALIDIAIKQSVTVKELTWEVVGYSVRSSFVHKIVPLGSAYIAHLFM